MPVIVRLQRANRGSRFRALSLRGAEVGALIDPFLGVDHAWMSGPTFPPHRHAGFSAVSYVFLDSETGIDNHDSIGTHNVISPGALHWTTAGRGVMHEEIPAETGKTVHSLQIFVNLPEERRNDEPFALSLPLEDIPVVRLPAATVRVPLGTFGDVRSSLTPPTEISLLDISIEGGAELQVPVASGQNVFVMPIHGALMIGGQLFSAEETGVPVFSVQATPYAIELRAEQGVAKAALFAGAPLN